jgi:hypothetical protein
VNEFYEENEMNTVPASGLEMRSMFVLGLGLALRSRVQLSSYRFLPGVLPANSMVFSNIDCGRQCDMSSTLDRGE